MTPHSPTPKTTSLFFCSVRARKKMDVCPGTQTRPCCGVFGAGHVQACLTCEQAKHIFSGLRGRSSETLAAFFADFGIFKAMQASDVRAGPQVCVQAPRSGTGYLNLGYFEDNPRASSLYRGRATLPPCTPLWLPRYRAVAIRFRTVPSHKLDPSAGIEPRTSG